MILTEIKVTLAVSQDIEDLLKIFTVRFNDMITFDRNVNKGL